VSSPEPEPEDEGIGALFARLIGDAKQYGRAEADYFRTLLSERVSEARPGLIAGGVAAVLGLSSVGALLVGLILTLSTVMPPGIATLVVIGATLAIVAWLGKFAATRLRNALRKPGERR